MLASTGDNRVRFWGMCKPYEDRKLPPRDY